MDKNNKEINYEEDSVVSLMKFHNIPMTRENYLKLAYLGDVPEITPELESHLPEIFQNKD